MKNRWTRWLPAVIVPAVIAAGALILPAAADAAPVLPAKSAQQLLELVASSVGTSYSGTVDQSSSLGLPSLTGIGPSSSAGSNTATGAALELLTAAHTAKVFVGVGQARLQVLDQLAERDVIATKAGVWIWDSKANTATHFAATTSAPNKTVTAPRGTPADLAQKLLASIDPSTVVTVTATARVAGRPVYQLVLTPRTGSTLVGSVLLSVDSATGVPLGVQLFAAGQTAPAFTVAFSAIDFATPDPSRFAFTPPAGATVTESPTHAAKPTTGAPVGGTAAKPTVIGTGWATVVEVPASAALAAGSAKSAAPSADTALLNRLLTPVTGGKALQTALLSVLLTDDGRLFVGAVSVEQLQAAAAR